MTTPKTVSIELLKPHRHAGRDYRPGARLTLPASKAEWLIGIGTATAADAAPAAETASAPEQAVKSAKVKG